MDKNSFEGHIGPRRVHVTENTRKGNTCLSLLKSLWLISQLLRLSALCPS